MIECQRCSATITAHQILIRAIPQYHEPSKVPFDVPKVQWAERVSIGDLCGLSDLLDEVHRGMVLREREVIMGVLACGRSNCTNIMCDRLILEGTHYICEDCFQELLVAKQTWPAGISKAELRKRMEEFFDTEVGAFQKLSAEDLDMEFIRLTSSPRYGDDE